MLHGALFAEHIKIGRHHVELLVSDEVVHHGRLFRPSERSNVVVVRR
jgi:hypothetical protein